MNDEQTASSGAARAFPNTRWSEVLAAARQALPESAAALENLCRAYWFPLYAFVRRSGHPPQDAEDLTQEFFCRLLEKGWLEAADPEKGKLRTFLIAALKHFLTKEWRRASAQRRGGGQPAVPLDTALAESRCAVDASSLPADEIFDRQWALTLLEHAVNRLKAEFAAAGKAEDFEALKGSLLAGRGTLDYAALAQQLRVGEATARVAVHRLRKRFREVFREEITLTLVDGADVEEEVRHLAAALARPENDGSL